MKKSLSSVTLFRIICIVIISISNATSIKCQTYGKFIDRPDREKVEIKRVLGPDSDNSLKQITDHNSRSAWYIQTSTNENYLPNYSELRDQTFEIQFEQKSFISQIDFYNGMYLRGSSVRVTMPRAISIETSENEIFKVDLDNSLEAQIIPIYSEASWIKIRIDSLHKGSQLMAISDIAIYGLKLPQTDQNQLRGTYSGIVKKAGKEKFARLWTYTFPNYHDLSMIKGTNDQVNSVRTVYAGRIDIFASKREKGEPVEEIYFLRKITPKQTGVIFENNGDIVKFSDSELKIYGSLPRTSSQVPSDLINIFIKRQLEKLVSNEYLRFCEIKNFEKNKEFPYGREFQKGELFARNWEVNSEKLSLIYKDYNASNLEDQWKILTNKQNLQNGLRSLFISNKQWISSSSLLSCMTNLNMLEIYFNNQITSGFDPTIPIAIVEIIRHNQDVGYKISFTENKSRADQELEILAKEKKERNDEIKRKREAAEKNAFLTMASAIPIDEQFDFKNLNLKNTSFFENIYYGNFNQINLHPSVKAMFVVNYFAALGEFHPFHFANNMVKIDQDIVVQRGWENRYFSNEASIEPRYSSLMKTNLEDYPTVNGFDLIRGALTNYSDADVFKVARVLMPEGKIARRFKENLYRFEMNLEPIKTVNDDSKIINHIGHVPLSNTQVLSQKELFNFFKSYGSTFGVDYFDIRLFEFEVDLEKMEGEFLRCTFISETTGKFYDRFFWYKNIPSSFRELQEKLPVGHYLNTIIGSPIKEAPQNLKEAAIILSK